MIIHGKSTQQLRYCEEGGRINKLKFIKVEFWRVWTGQDQACSIIPDSLAMESMAMRLFTSIFW